MEVEAKYTVPDPATFERLLTLTQLGEYELRLAGEHYLTDHYFDTPGYALRRGGYACRLREQNGQWRATVKSLNAAQGAVHRRDEYEAEVTPGAAPLDWPDGPGRDRVLALLGAETLNELLVIRQRRAAREVWQAQRRVGEWALDVVDVEAGKRSAVSYELEIELAPDGTLADLQALAEALRALALQPQPLSKFERALTLLELAKPEKATAPKPKTLGVRAEDSMADAARKILRFHYERMLAREAGTRSGDDPEDLHDMRVATRRQRAALRLFIPYFKPKTIRPIRRALKELATHLGAVRDLDVFAAALQTFQSTALAEPAALQPFVDHIVQQRELARQDLLAYLDSEAYQSFLKGYERFLAAKGKRVSGVDDKAPPVVQHALPGKLWEQYALVRAFESILPWTDVPILHTLRIEAKRLRYALEFFREVLPANANECIQTVVALQDHLGELHDADVALTRVRAFLVHGAQTQLAPEAMQAAGRYLASRQTKLQQLRRTVGRPWRKVIGKRFKQVLAKAVAGL